MSENTAGFYDLPPAEVAQFYERRSDGKYYIRADLEQAVAVGQRVQLLQQAKTVCGLPYVTKSDVKGVLQIGDVEVNLEPKRGFAVGDIDSTERGTAARALGPDKYQAELIPARLWCEHVQGRVTHDLLLSMQSLADFQEGGGGVDLSLTLSDWWKSAARVFAYGALKYAEWNWLRGMKWSIPIGCAVRHVVDIASGEEIDPESGLPHIGHYMCNLIMLNYFVDHYPEGDDRPSPKYFE